MMKFSVVKLLVCQGFPIFKKALLTFFGTLIVATVVLCSKLATTLSHRWDPSRVSLSG